MIPFHAHFLEVARSETRSLHVLCTGGPVPIGEYRFIEHYCGDPACDCRRVVIRVTSAEPPHPVLATINYGRERAEFYTRWMHGDSEAAREITAASLDPLNPQSQYAEFFLEYLQDCVLTDPAYVARLRRHYELFKSIQRPRPSASSALNKAMTTDEILRSLEKIPSRCEFAPYETALQAAIAQREIITPHLIAAIDRVSAAPGEYIDRPENSLHLFAIYLLAQFRERRALDAFIRIFSLRDELSLDLTGDMVTQHGGA